MFTWIDRKGNRHHTDSIVEISAKQSVGFKVFGIWW